MMLEFEIFSTGTHQTTNGESLEFTESDLQKSCRAYDPDTHEAPLVLGAQPKHDDPAYGWVKTLRLSSGRVLASIGQLDPSFLGLTGAGYARLVSSTFYRPAAATNPVPGVWYLRNVSYTGLEKPTSNTRLASFSESEGGIVVIGFGALSGHVEFGEAAATEDALVIARAASAFQEQRRKLGQFVSTTDAVNYVCGKPCSFAIR
jgi:hypothetical protein